MKKRSGQYQLFWIIVPFMGSELSSLLNFLSRHVWFLENGGRILLKSRMELPRDVKQTLRDPNITLLEIPDKSIYDAWNQALEYLNDQQLSDESYITWLGLDDFLQQSFLINSQKKIREKSYPEFIFGNIYGVFAERYRLLEAPELPDLFGNGPFCFDVFHPGMLNRWGSVRNRRFDTRYKLAADLDFYVAMGQEKTVRYLKIDEVQAIIGSDGISQNPTAKSIYAEEWRQIAKTRGISISVDRKRMFFFRIIAKAPILFRIIRSLYWVVAGLRARG